MIVTLSDFNNEAKIPGLFPIIGSSDPVNVAIQNEVNSFIEEYEPVYLEMFFNTSEEIQEIEDYNDLEEKTDERKNELIKSLKVAIANFVAFYLFRDNTTFNTSIGAIIPRGESGAKTNNVNRSVFVWNKMAKETRKAYRVYYRKCIKKDAIFQDINIFGV